MCHARLAIALAQTGRLDRAIAEFREAFRLDPADLNIRIDLANVLLAKGEVGEAAKLCREVLEKDPYQTRAAMILSLALSAGGESTGPKTSNPQESPRP